MKNFFCFLFAVAALPGLSPAASLSIAERASEARIFAEKLVWVGTNEPQESESQSLYELVKQVREQIDNPVANVASRSKGGLTYNFNVNPVNAPTNVTRSGALTVVGFATNDVTSVTVNGQAATLYGSTFAASGVTLSNGPNTFTAIARDDKGRKATNIVTASYPATLACTNDANGNLVYDGKRNYIFDAENRATEFYVTNVWRTTLAYDGLSRIRVRREYNWTNGAWKLTNEVRLIYDGYLVIQERDSNNVPKITYTRGLDLGGTFQGAGGIGGMLGMTTHTNTTNYTHYFFHSDGGGNITALVDTNQAVQAQWAYEPFGGLWSQSGPLTNLCRYRFSSKEWHPQSALYLYQFRIYAPDFQRWLTEDPVGVSGGINLKRFCDNDPLDWADSDGFQPVRPSLPPPPPVEGELTRDALGGLRENYQPGNSYRQPSFDYRNPSQIRFDERAEREARRAEMVREGRDPNVAELRPARPPRQLELPFDPAKLRCPEISQSSQNAPPTSLYQKVGSEGEHLKFGVTDSPSTRYSAEQLNGGRLRILAEGERSEMLRLEREIHETLPLGREERQKFYIRKQVEKGLLPPSEYPFPP